MTAQHDYTIVPTHIDLIRPYDTVMHGGLMRTVCVKDVKRGGFMGTTLFGDSYRSGLDLVQLVKFKDPRA